MDTVAETIAGLGRNVFPEAEEAPAETASIPTADDFDEGDDFLDAPDLADIAARLVREHEETFWAASRIRVSYLWKKSGGKVCGKPKMGDCARPGGLTRHVGDLDFVIWLAADNCRGAGFTVDHVRNEIAHQLLHVGYDLETGKPSVKTHDFDGFSAEVRLFGLWREGLRTAKRAVEQAKLAGFEG